MTVSLRWRWPAQGRPARSSFVPLGVTAFVQLLEFDLLLRRQQSVNRVYGVLMNLGHVKIQRFMQILRTIMRILNHVPQGLFLPGGEMQFLAEPGDPALRQKTSRL